MHKITCKTKDGLLLTGIWHVPTNKSSKVIILAHGITVDKDEGGVFIKLANVLQQNGYAVFRFDFRGHGESEGKSIDLTVMGEVADLVAALNEVKNKGYNKIGLLGASFGGGSSVFFALDYQQDIKCLCLWNPVLNYDHTFLNPTLPWLKDKKGHMMKDIKEKGWTTLGSRKYVIGKSLFDDMAKIQPYIALKSIKIPTVIIHGTNDTKVPYEDSKEYVTLLIRGKLLTIENSEHGFHETGETDKAINATVEFFQANL